MFLQDLCVNARTSEKENNNNTLLSESNGSYESIQTIRPNLHPLWRKQLLSKTRRWK